ncbi:MAG TPA: RNA polymerase factor sigma-54 [Alphaproteobacteria bacterium]|nr:RNA polymerase factor sigma-54 [Alphaproteobacteria bacterium]
MALVQRLDLRQSQTLVMTPQLQQAIKLLQLSNLEIGEFVAQELQQNPLLEEGGPDLDQAGPRGEGEPAEAAAGGDDRAAAADAQAEQIESGVIAEAIVDGPDGGDGGLDERVGTTSYGMGGREFDGEASDAADRLSRDPSLRDHLFEQLNTDITDSAARLIGALLIEAVEPSGYLAEGDEAVHSVAATLGVDRRDVEAVLARMQRFDPPGVLARNLSECLALQLADRNRYDPAMAALCANLHLLAERRFSELCRICGVDQSDLADMIAEIKALDPKPGERFESNTAAVVVPDILMRSAPAGGWIVELNPDTLPRLLVNRRYYAEINQSCRTAKEREYLSERLNAANWLVRSLDQRANTILKVASEIVQQQTEFFQHGVTRLRPLVLRNIAEVIGMHESTVSRVTNNKYIATPRGLFELKYFFSAAIQGADGGASFAAESIRHRIKAVIDAESPREILSDDAIVDMLQGDGIDIARRTVAKYREQLGIASSVQRRREKNLRRV